MKIRKKTLVYIAFSIALAELLIWTAPFQALTTVKLGRYYIIKDDLQRIMVILFPLLALIGAFISRKQRTVENVFLNAAAGMTVLLALRCLENHPVLTISLLIAAAACSALAGFWVSRRYDYETTEKIRYRIFQNSRRIIIYSLLIVLGTFAMVTSWKEQRERNRLQREETITVTQEESAEQPEEDASVLRNLVVSKETWKGLSIPERQDKIISYTQAALSELGLEGDYAVTFTKGLTNDNLAWYNDNDRRIDFNDAWIGTADQEDILNAIFHEVFHAYQARVVITVYMPLLEQGAPVDKWPDLQRVKEYAYAYATYGADSMESFEAYEDNPLEFYARQYAEEQVGKLQDYLS